MTTGDRPGEHGESRWDEQITGWTSPGTAALVDDVTLWLAEDIHRTWDETDEEAPPFWAFAWAGGQALARYVLDHPETVRGRRVLDLAAGSGLVGLAAVRAGAAAVIASDTDARARAAIALNATANGAVVQIVGDVTGADAAADSAAEPAADPAAESAADDGELDVDVILAGDVFYEQPMARHVEAFLDLAVGAGVEVLVGDPGREYLPRRRCTALAVHDVPDTADLEGRAVTPTTVWAFGPRERSVGR